MKFLKNSKYKSNKLFDRINYFDTKKKLNNFNKR